MEPSLDLDDLYQWHHVQSQSRDITEETRLFHIKAMTLLTSIDISIVNLRKTLAGEI